MYLLLTWAIINCRNGIHYDSEPAEASNRPVKKLTRRTIVKLLAAAWPGLLLPRASSYASTPDEFPIDTFRALIDTFVPEDDWAGALVLEIDRQLLETVLANAQYRANVRIALLQLDDFSRRIHGRKYLSLDLETRTHLLDNILNSRSGGTLRVQLDSLRLKTLTRFYTSPQAFALLDYHPPSQGGYPDYADPPA